MKKIVKKPAIKKAQTGDTIYTKKSAAGNVRTNRFVVRNSDGSIEMGKVTKTKTPDGKTTVSKNAQRSLPLGLQYTDDEIRSSMNQKKNGGSVKKSNWIKGAIKKPGALRKALGAKKGEPIPAKKLAAAAKKPGKLGQRARLAQTLKKMKK